MKIKCPKIQGNYVLQLRNTITNETKTYTTHNVITNIGIIRMLNGHYASSAIWAHIGNGVDGIICGSGSGTPSASDTGVFTSLFTATKNNDSSVTVTSVSSVWKDEEHSIKDLTFKILIPAKSSYVGTITEVALHQSYYDSSYVRDAGILTHALLLDAEGNPMSIVKTDIDELTVTITFSIQRDLNSKLRWYMRDYLFGDVYRWIYGSNVGSTQSYTPFLYKYFCLTRGVTDDVKKTSAFTCTAASASNNESAATITISNNRFEASTGGSFFVNGIYKTNGSDNSRPLFMLRFPATDIFAERTLTGLTLAAGDGTTTEFTPPLPMWVKDSEQIYKNETLLTRDVDYTCDNIGNIQNAIEATPGNFVDKIISNASDTGYIPGTDQPGQGGFSETYPMILKYYTDPLVGNSINAIIPGAWANVVANTKVTFLVSEDGETYNEIYSFTCTTTSYSDTTLHQLDQTYTLKYLKITVEFPSTQSDKSTRVIYNSSAGSCMFLHHTQGIVFTEAPTETDVITMNATIDRPWKSPEYIIDFNPVLQF